MMKETKTCFRFFSIMDYEKEAPHVDRLYERNRCKELGE